MSESWERHRVAVGALENPVRLRIKPVITVTSMEAVARLRIGLWMDEERKMGFELPFVPEHSTVTIDSVERRVYMANENSPREITRNYVKGWDGPLNFTSIPNGDYTLTVDQLTERAVPVRVELYGVQTAR